jgi:MtN3 and saliva related transmembrane protein
MDISFPQDIANNATGHTSCDANTGSAFLRRHFLGNITRLIKGRTAMSRSVAACSVAAVLALSLSLCGCKDLAPLDTASLIDPQLRRSEVVGFLAGLGTTFAAIPDLIAMFKRRSSAGMNPRMAAIMGAFQILWIYYGLLIASRPVIVWNVIAVAINFLAVAAYCHYVRKERIAGAR